jgi:transposase
VLFEADRSRGQEVPQRLLAGFTGIAHSDFYGSYFAVKGLVHATCWAHLLREARQLAERQPCGYTKLFFGALTRLYQRAAAAQQHQTTAALVAPQLRAELLTLAQDTALGRHKEVRRLQGRLTKFCDDLLRFVTDPRLEGTNNRAERELRPVAMARHVGGGARSDDGARTYALNLSIARTAAQQGQPLESVFRAARAAYHNGAEFPPLVTTPA